MSETSFEAGDVWRDSMGTRTIVAVYDRDVLIHWVANSGASNAMSLPKWLFSAGRCGTVARYANEQRARV